MTASLLFSEIAHPYDANGLYMKGGGAGGVECPDFVKSMSVAKAAGVGTLGYVEEIQGFAAFLSGYQTAFNNQTANTCDIFAGVSINQMLSWVENYCKQNPLETYASGVVELSSSVYKKRRQSCK